jgi:two-component system, NtrC family, response regulator AtoC
MKLVLVDDEPAILDVLAAACSADGHSVVTFSSSSDALRYLDTHQADLLITDIVMPPPDGFRLVSAARKTQPGLDAILVTGYCSRYSLEDMLACGATDLLFKPFRLQELRARIRLAQARKRMVTLADARPRQARVAAEPPTEIEVEARRALYALRGQRAG